MRLGAYRDKLKKQKTEEEEAKQAAARAMMPEERKRDEGDVFRNTGMKFNETEAEKRKRLFRCLAALKSSGIGKPSPFMGMEVGKPVSIDWSKSSDQVDQSESDSHRDFEH